MPFTRRHQLYAVAEADEGVYQAPSPSGLRFVHDPVVTPEYTTKDRNPVAESLSREASEIGRKFLKWTFGVDFGTKGSTGSPAVPALPLWTTFLKACGMREIRIKSLSIAGSPPTITNTITHGTRIFDTTTLAQGIAVGTYTGTTHTKVFYIPTDAVGIVPSGPLTHFGAGNTCQSLDAPAGSFVISASGLEQDEGYAYRPSDHIVWHVDTNGAWGVRVPEVWESFLGLITGAWGLILRPVDSFAGSTRLYYEPLFSKFAGTGSPPLEGIATNISPFATNTLRTASLAPNSNYTLSLATILGQTLFSARGCRGNWKLNAESGEPMRLEFEFMGIQEGITALPAHIYNAPVVESSYRFQSANFTLDGKLGHRIKKLEFDLGAALTLREDPSYANGAQSYIIADRSPVGAMDPEFTVLNAHDFWAKWADSTPVSIKTRMGLGETVLGTPSHVVGTGLWIDVPSAQYDPVTIGDREGLMTAEASFAARRRTWYGEDEVWIYLV